MSFFNPKRRLLSFKYALQGIRWAFSTQPNIWIHLIIAICVIILGFYLNVKQFDWIVLIICIIIVFAIELINTAIEWLVDSIYKEKNLIAGKIKDVAAAAVLVVAMGVAIIGSIIFYPYFKEQFF